MACPRYDEFFNKEYVLYSVASVQRAIPALMDGLKPSQRKVGADARLVAWSWRGVACVRGVLLVGCRCCSPHAVALCIPR